MNAFDLKTVASESVFRLRFDDFPTLRPHAALRKLNMRLLSKRTFNQVDANGHDLLIPEIEVNTWWTNLPCRPETVVELYHDHGTSEQFHSELKSDLGVERLPSGKLCANKIILLCAMVAFNLLRTLGQEVLERKDLAPQKLRVGRWRLKTVLQNIIYCAVRLVRHAGRIELHFGKRCPWFDVIRDIAYSLA
jgi:hypothetical protein